MADYSGAYEGQKPANVGRGHSNTQGWTTTVDPFASKPNMNLERKITYLAARLRWDDEFNQARHAELVEALDEWEKREFGV